MRAIKIILFLLTLTIVIEANTTVRNPIFSTKSFPFTTKSTSMANNTLKNQAAANQIFSTQKSMTTTKQTSLTTTRTTAKSIFNQIFSTQKSMTTTKQTTKQTRRRTRTRTTTKLVTSKTTQTTKQAKSTRMRATAKSVRTTKELRSQSESTRIPPILRQSIDDIRRIYQNLNFRESRVAGLIDREMIRLKNTRKRLKDVPKLQTTVEETIQVYENIITTANFAIFKLKSTPNVSVCMDVILKISATESDMELINAVLSCVSVNATVLTNLVRTMSIDFDMYKNVVPPTVNFPPHIMSGNEIIVEMKNYTTALTEASDAEAQINQNLNNYKNEECQSHTTIPTTTTTQAILQTRQCRSINGTVESDTTIAPLHPNAPCGTFVHYDVVNERNFPELYGFQGGVHSKDNETKQYVGYGSSCDDEDPVPCYIDTNPSKPGCFIPCFWENYDNRDAYYLLSHPKLKWVPTDSNQVSNVPGVQTLQSGRYTFMFGRIIYKGFYQVGKIVDGPLEFNMQIRASDRTLRFTTGFEVLTCTE